MRTRQVDLKRAVAEGKRHPADIVLEERDTGNLTVYDLLKSQRRWGPERTRKMLFKAGIPEKKELRTLTDRQRRALALFLRPPGTAGR